MQEEYDVIEFQGKHGLIRLHVPKREPTEQEIADLHTGIARALYNDKKLNKDVKKATS